jgi:hypothetical protein
MARATRADRPNAPPSGAADIGTYGITPAAAITSGALALGVTPVLAADDGVPAAVASPSGTALAAPASVIADGQDGSVFAAALGPPAFLLEQAGAIASTMRAATDAAPTTRDAPAADHHDDAPSASGGSGTPPGLIQIDQSAPSAAPAVSDAASGVSGVSAPGGTGLQSSLDAVDGRIEGMRVAIGEQLEEIAGRIDAIEAEASTIVSEVENTVSDTIDAASARVAEIGDAADGLVASISQIDLGDVAGADPAAGITTLVGMVSAADIFGLHDIGMNGVGELPLPFMSGADMSGLTEFAPADVLLAVPDHDGAFGLVDGLIDGHHG